MMYINIIINPWIYESVKYHGAIAHLPELTAYCTHVACDFIILVNNPIGT